MYVSNEPKASAPTGPDEAQNFDLNGAQLVTTTSNRSPPTAAVRSLRTLTLASREKTLALP